MLTCFPWSGLIWHRYVRAKASEQRSGKVSYHLSQEQDNLLCVPTKWAINALKMWPDFKTQLFNNNSPIYRWGNWGYQRLSYLPKAMEPLKCKRGLTLVSSESKDPAVIIVQKSHHSQEAEDLSLWTFSSRMMGYSPSLEPIRCLKPWHVCHGLWIHSSLMKKSCVTSESSHFNRAKM